MIAAEGLHWLAGLGRAPGLAGMDGGWRPVRVLAGLGQWLVPGVLLLTAVVSGYRSWRGQRLRRTLAADPRTLALADLGWGEFGRLVAEVFRARGYRVKEPAQSSTGGGHLLLIDGLDGNTLVLCRHWHAWRVGAAEVQELIAAMGAKGARRGVLVISGEFTRDARRLAEGRPLELLDGAGLQALAQGPSPVPAPAGRCGRWRQRWRFNGPGLRVRLRPTLHLAGTLAVAAALYHGFQWVMSLPDKRLAPPMVPEPMVAADPGPVILVPKPVPTSVPPPPPPPPPGLGGFRSVQELEAAFDAFYVPPPGCASPASRTDLVECANHRIRAREGFMVAGTPLAPEPEAGPGDQSEVLVEDIPTDEPAWYDPATTEALAPPGASTHTPEGAEPDASAGALGVPAARGRGPASGRGASQAGPRLDLRPLRPPRALAGAVTPGPAAIRQSQ